MYSIRRKFTNTPNFEYTEYIEDDTLNTSCGLIKMYNLYV